MGIPGCCSCCCSVVVVVELFFSSSFRGLFIELCALLVFCSLVGGFKRIVLVVVLVCWFYLIAISCSRFL